MGTTLTGTTPQDTYDSLIKVTDNGPISGTAKYLSDGLGNDSALALSTGNIGIGTNTPDSNLVVNGSASVRVNLRASNVRYGTIYADNGIVALSSITAIPLVLATDDTERMRITSAGNVAIGTSSPAAKLQVVGGGETTSIANAATTSTSRFDVANPAVSLGIGYVAADIPMIQSFNNLTNTAVNLTINRFGGNVGIATSTPVVPLDVTGNIRSSTGILFGSDTAAANALDDYEEGTWTMGVSFGGASTGVTYGLNTGTYTKIGRQVTVNGFLLLTSKGSSTGSASITGLPFTVPNNTANYAAPSLWINNITFANQYNAVGSLNTTRISLEEVTELGVSSGLTNADFANNSELIVSFTYFV